MRMHMIPYILPPPGVPREQQVAWTVVENAMQHAFLGAYLPAVVRLPLKDVAIFRPPPPKLPPSTSDAFFFFGSIQTEHPSMFVSRVHKTALCRKATLLRALILLKRVAAADPMLAITPYTGHRLLITAIVAASHAENESKPGMMVHYAKLCGLTDPEELFLLERAMLRVLDNQAHVSREDYDRIYNEEFMRISFLFSAQ